MKTRSARRALLGTIAVLTSIAARVLAADSNGCALLLAGSDTLPTTDCVNCHRSAMGSHSHPVDTDYAYASSRPRSGLRPMADVVKRGLLLVDGKISCTTCHDSRSPWKYRLALPPGAVVRPSVVAGDATTYDSPAAIAPPQPGADVGRKPLCLACHAFD